ncbi:LacI family DNA-binding transcriptional regulator, partial [Testudinibacter sp. TR-2022]
MPTMKDIAKEAEVSLGTVSNVLNEKGNVSLKKIRKVQDAIQKLGYQKNAQAGFLKKGNTNKIAVILPNIRSIKYQSLYEELEYVFYQEGYQLNLYLTCGIPEKEKELINLISSENYFSLIVVSCLDDGKYYETVFKDNVDKIIFVYNKLKNVKYFFDLNYVEIGKKLAEDLIDKNIRKVGVFELLSKVEKQSIYHFITGYLKKNKPEADIKLIKYD